MSFKENIEKRLKEKGTKELKPGLFIREMKDKHGASKYRRIYPLVWNGNWRMKEQFSIKNLVVIAIFLFLAWSYNNDNAALVEFHNNVVEDPVRFCVEVQDILRTRDCPERYQGNGICYFDIGE